MARLRILVVASEYFPFAKSGGLADVTAALSQELAKQGHDVRVVLPRYGCTFRFGGERLAPALLIPTGLGDAWGAVFCIANPNQPTIYLLEHHHWFDREGLYGDSHGTFGDNLIRFSFLSRGALALCQAIDFQPDVIHIHDWQAAFVPVYMRMHPNSFYNHTATVLTIHNLGYQGIFSRDQFFQLGLHPHLFTSGLFEFHGNINVLKAGIYSSTMVTTVSPQYAYEIQTPLGGHQLDGVIRDRVHDTVGILNGIDTNVWNPSTDPYVSYSYTSLKDKHHNKQSLQHDLGLQQRPDVPLFAIVSRLAYQKGIDLFAASLRFLLTLDYQFVVLGQGDAWAEDLFRRIQHESYKFRVRIANDEPLAHRIYAGADFLLVPSRYEPCGLSQLYAQRYGTLPIVRSVGGLVDTVTDEFDGYRFDAFSPDELNNAVMRAADIYKKHPDQDRAMRQNAMNKPLGWDHAAKQYEAVFRLAIRKQMQKGE